jgi:hypothetical protein
MINWEETENIIINLKYPLSFFYLLNKNYKNININFEYDYICALFIKHHFDLFVDYNMELLLDINIKDRNINEFFKKLKKVLYFSKIYHGINKSIKNPSKIDLLEYFKKKKVIFNGYFGSYPIYAKYYELIINNDNIFLSIMKEILNKSIKLFGIKFYLNLGIKILSNYDFDILSGKDKLIFINEFHINTQKALDITISNLRNYNRDKEYINNIQNYKKLKIELIEMEI